MHRRRQQIATWKLVASLCAVWFLLRSPARLSASHLQIHLFIDSDVALGTLLRGTSRQSYCNELDTGFWFEIAAQTSAVPRMTGSFEDESGRVRFASSWNVGCSGCSSYNVSDGTVTHSTLTLVLADPWPFWIQRPLVGCATTFLFTKPDVFAQLVFIELLRRKSQCVVPTVGAFLPLAGWPVYGSNGGRGLNSSSGAYVSFRPRCVVRKMNPRLAKLISMVRWGLLHWQV